MSQIVRAELSAALWRKHRDGDLDTDAVRTLERRFASDLFDRGRFLVVAINATVLDLAAELVADHPLRAFDAVQLASALAARRADPDCTTFACFDVRLARAARAEGFAVLGAGG